jgi:hypothetical protein
MPLPNDFVSIIGYAVRTLLSFADALTLSSETRMQTIRIRLACAV